MPAWRWPVREPRLLIGWAQPAAENAYDSAQLSLADSKRAGQWRGPKAEREWRVSRALLQTLRPLASSTGVTSLSHSAGHALCILAPAGWEVGVDLEPLRPRKVLALAQWACDEEEKTVLSGLAGDAQQEAFYLLWTIKEAFVKAAQLQFPSDLRSVGLAGGIGNKATLRAPGEGWRAQTWRLGADWVASVVWRAPVQTDAQWEWQAGPASTVPERRQLGSW